MKSVFAKVQLLRTTSQFDDFELKLEYRCPQLTNSGIFLRTSSRPEDPATDCYELNIAPDSHPFPTGSLVGRVAGQKIKPNEQWHHIRVKVIRSKIKIWIDEQLVTEYDDPHPLGKGYIGLQFNRGEIAFRNIRLKPLRMTSIPATPTFPHWNVNLKGDSKFGVVDQDTLQITGGRGQLETVGRYADFIFSAQIKTNAVGLNSGIFFRCIPGELMNGYESQIQNQFLNDDRTQPADCGSGGIFRRINARFVNADDKKWFTKTIIVTGPHISVWVNSDQVTDWTDNRPAHRNPRKGKRLEAGTIIFQGHDPTTDILFRQIQIKELTKRVKQND